MSAIRDFIKKEPVLIISALCAAATMFFIPPDKEYLGYIDFRVLCLLFCLMAVVAGFRSVGIFNALTYRLLSRIRSGRALGVTLVMLAFFSSMLVTNDVALIIFVPFTIALLAESGCSKSIIPVIVIQTVAANLGSMATPVGNPQNLFLYSAFELTASEFFSVTLPLTAVSLIILIPASLFLLPKSISREDLKKESVTDGKRLLVYILLFALSLLTVFRVIPYQVTAVITALVFLIINRKAFREIDFMLLLTFVCFFVLSENLGRIEAVKNLLCSLLEKSTLLASIGASQVISNVPAAVLLSGFTDNWRELLSGVNIGGLGTPVASLASLITLKFYLKLPNAKLLRFAGVFTLANLIGLIVLTGFQMIFFG